MILAGIAPINAPFCNPDGTLTQIGINMISSLLQRTGGPTGIDVTVVKTVATGANAAASSAQMTADQALPRSGGTMTGPLILAGAPGAVNAAAALPVVDGTAAVGTSSLYARGDHVHPTDISRYAAANPAGYQTAAQVNATLASPPAIGGTTPNTGAFTSLKASGAFGAFGKAPPAAQPAAPVTLADVIAIIRLYGLSA